MENALAKKTIWDFWAPRYHRLWVQRVSLGPTRALIHARVEEAAVMQEEVRDYSAPFSAGGVPLLKQALARKLPGYPVHVRVPLCDCPNPAEPEPI